MKKLLLTLLACGEKSERRLPPYTEGVAEGIGTSGEGLGVGSYFNSGIGGILAKTPFFKASGRSDQGSKPSGLLWY
ncbi:hypothetical protein NIES2100_67600 [Calothrix sp. NIES-2100]|nr:hypothetical protein NIES2100_67600 [Calothrix sp. NIES-2100]